MLKSFGAIFLQDWLNTSQQLRNCAYYDSEMLAAAEPYFWDFAVKVWRTEVAVDQTVPVCLAIIRECLWTSKGFGVVTDLSLPQFCRSFRI